ncbi:MAG: outer membrane protein [Devosia sp.]|uniref:hypothetical protein n=1 Tax=Devosia sp. TaxID=1871048 RepID=UPI00260826A8|nr:hypothetical protein [Devosia sp.]MDB5542802.1 outer membrane protein [Devosia sp.]
MKIRSLLLGSLAAAGLSTGGAYAADLGVLTSLDVCDALGLSGLTISSDTNCLQITGEVKYKFIWGDYSNTDIRINTAADDGDVTFISGDGFNDWDSRFDAWIRFAATADSDFGPAKAILKLKQVSQSVITDETSWSNGSSTSGVILDEAYVSIGDATVIMAGKKGSLMKKGEDEPLNWLGLFNSEDVDLGVSWGPHVALGDGGHVIQVVSDLGNGVSIGAGLEKLDNDDPQEAGTAVGVISYAGEGIAAHLTVAAAGVLDGEVESWGAHAGFAGTFDNFKVVLAGAFGHDDLAPSDYWNVLASASATFDMFTLAGSVEAINDSLYDETDYGAGVSLSATVSEGVTVNVGGRWYQANIYDAGADNYQVAASVSAAVTETIIVTGEVGFVRDRWDDLVYGSAKLAWAPGGGYTSSVKGTVTSTEDRDVGYKIESEFKKTFE